MNSFCRPYVVPHTVKSFGTIFADNVLYAEPALPSTRERAGPFQLYQNSAEFSKRLSDAKQFVSMSNVRGRLRQRLSQEDYAALKIFPPTFDLDSSLENPRIQEDVVDHRCKIDYIVVV